MNERMREIEARLAEIRTAVEMPDADLDALETESRNLTAEYERLQAQEEETERRNAILQRAAERGRVTRRFGAPETDGTENRTFAVDSPEYRSAWLRNLQGRELNAEERTAVTASSAIPTQTMNMIVGKLKLNPLLNAIDMMHIPGNISIPVAGTVNAASWVAMGTASADSADSITSISLAAYKLIKTVEITADVQAMAIDAFESWLTANLANQIDVALDAAVLKGTGSSQATGINTTIADATGTFTKAAMKYKDLMAIIAALPTEYVNNATFVMSRKVFYGEVLGMETTSGDKVVVADAQAPGKFNILGFPVIVDDNATISSTDTVFFGDLKEYKMNFAKDPEVKRDDSVGFRTGTSVYRAMALVDGKLADTKAIVKFTRATA